jgi:DNA-binding NarL/FixJ family response regulator
MSPGSVQTIKLPVIDDVPYVRRGLRMRLSLESELQVVGDVACSEEALLTAIRGAAPSPAHSVALVGGRLWV